MIQFKPITLTDKNIITSYTLAYAPGDCDFSFTNLCSWHFINHSSYAIIDHFLVIRFSMEDGRIIYLLPIGEGDLKPVIRQLEQESQEVGQPLRIQGIYSQIQEILESCFPDHFEYTRYRDYDDYIYLRQNLSELKGKHYQPKRNHVNKFKKEYVYQYIPLTPEIMPQCLEFESQWLLGHDYIEQESLKDEGRALIYAMHHFEELGLTGGAIRVGDQLVAFTFGMPINENTFDIQAEKANIHIDGAYSIINQEFASRLSEQYTYINREEDLGFSGLRKSKLSYHPTVILDKCIAVKTS